MVKQRLVCPECMLRVFLSTVKCLSCNCFFHSGEKKGAKIDAANWSENWCCSDCSSMKISTIFVNSLNLPVFASPCIPCSLKSRARMLSIQTELR